MFKKNITAQVRPAFAKSSLYLALLFVLCLIGGVTWFVYNNYSATISCLSRLSDELDKALFNNKTRPISEQKVSIAERTKTQTNSHDANSDIQVQINKLNKQPALLKQKANYHNRLGILYGQIGNFASAAQQFNQAIEICYKQIKQINQPTDLSNVYVELTCAHSNLARIYNKMGQHDQVLIQLQELNKDIAFAGDNYIYTTVQNKKVRSAVAQAKNSNNKLDTATAASLARAEALSQLGRISEAKQEYIRLIRLNPNLAIAHHKLGLLAVQNYDLPQSINELQIAAQLDPKDPNIENDLGLVYLQLGDYTAAKQALVRAHKLDPNHLNATINLANMFAASGDYKSALSIMHQATIAHPSSATVHNNFAAILAKTGDEKGAAKEFTKAISLNPSLPSAHYGLGIALLNLKSYPAAAQEFKVAMSLNPGILDLQNKIDLANRCNFNSFDTVQNMAN